MEYSILMDFIIKSSILNDTVVLYIGKKVKNIVNFQKISCDVCTSNAFLAC